MLFFSSQSPRSLCVEFSKMNTIAPTSPPPLQHWERICKVCSVPEGENVFLHIVLAWPVMLF